MAISPAFSNETSLEKTRQKTQQKIQALYSKDSLQEVHNLLMKKFKTNFPNKVFRPLKKIRTIDDAHKLLATYQNIVPALNDLMEHEQKISYDQPSEGKKHKSIEKKKRKNSNIKK